MPFEKNNIWAKLKKGMKYQPTLDKERRREIFDKEVTQVWKDIIKELSPEYIANQFIGKPKETMELQGVEFTFNNEKCENKSLGKGSGQNGQTSNQNNEKPSLR